MSKTQDDDRGERASYGSEVDPDRGIFGLGLTPEELRALRTQGFVAVEHRGTRRRFKLRFRLAGQQRVRYLGVDERFAELVRQQLSELQKRRRTMRLLRTEVRRTRRILWESKQELEPELVARGYRYHGRAIRRRRRSVA